MSAPRCAQGNSLRIGDLTRDNRRSLHERRRGHRQGGGVGRKTHIEYTSPTSRNKSFLTSTQTPRSSSPTVAGTRVLMLGGWSCAHPTPWCVFFSPLLLHPPTSSSSSSMPPLLPSPPLHRPLGSGAKDKLLSVNTLHLF